MTIAADPAKTLDSGLHDMQIKLRPLAEKRKKALTAIAVFAVAFLPLVFVWAQDEPVAEKPPVSITTARQTSTQEQANTASASGAVANPPASSTQTAKPVKQFKPTDKIGADSAVSFPVDI